MSGTMADRSARQSRDLLTLNVIGTLQKPNIKIFLNISEKNQKPSTNKIAHARNYHCVDF